MMGFGGRAAMREEETSARLGELADCLRALAGLTEDMVTAADRAEAGQAALAERVERIEARLEEVASVARHGLLLMETAPGVRSAHVEAGVALVRLKTGLKLYVPSADPGFAAQLMVAGQWQPRLGAVLRRLVRPGHLCVDLGAECGYFTVAMAAAAGPEGRVLAFEPAEEAFELLRRSLWANGFSQDGRAQVCRGLPGAGEAPDLDEALARADPSGAAPVLLRLGDDTSADVLLASEGWLSRPGEVALVAALGDRARQTAFREGEPGARLAGAGFEAIPVATGRSEDVVAFVKPAGRSATWHGAGAQADRALAAAGG